MSDRSATTPLLKADNLHKRFGGFIALNGITLHVRPGERLGLIGPNGSGKSTLVNCLCGVLDSDSGNVEFDGRVMNGMNAHQRTRAGMARSFQLPRPFRSLTLAENVRVPLLFSLESRGLAPGSSRELDERCLELLASVALESKARRMPAELTQVELRKLELARAIATRPKLLFADEAMAGLSDSEVGEIVSFLIQLNETGVTIILIEHIMSAVMRFSNRLIVLVSGEMIADGSPESVLRDPQVEAAYLGK